MHKRPFPLVLSQTYGVVSRLLATANSTVVLRKNGANGNETFSIGANTTGAFSDATDTDSIASGDKIAVGITPGSTALVITIIAATFSSTNMSNTVTHMLSFQDLSSQPTVTGTYYSTPSGVTAYKTSSYNSTEANSKLRLRKAFTVNNFATFVTGGGGGTLNSRKNGANGNITVNLNVGSAQLVQDTTHSDNLAVGDDFDWQFSDTGTNYSYDFYSCDFTSTNGDCIFACATDDPVTSINTSVTAYYGLAGSLDTSQSIETNAQVTVNNAFKFSQLTCNVTSNSIIIPDKWLHAYELRRSSKNPKELKEHNEKWISSKYDIQNMHWTELQQLYLPDLGMCWGPSCNSLKKLWKSYKIAGRTGEVRSDIAWNIRNIQRAMGIPESQFEELEGMDDEETEGSQEVEENWGFNSGISEEEL